MQILIIENLIIWQKTHQIYHQS